MVRFILPGAAALTLLAGGCIIFTGGTGGYALENGATCTTSSLCASTACCYTLDADAGVPSAACAASCASAFEQACTSDGECGQGGACQSQSCTGTVNGVTASATVKTCGAIPATIATCTAE